MLLYILLGMMTGAIFAAGLIFLVKQGEDVM